MRCSSCELLLDPFLEGTLSPREAAGVAAHVRRCKDCAELFRELRVIDALLTTAQAPSVGADFTATVVSATNATPVRSGRPMPFGVALLLYVVIAWTVTAFALRSAPLASLAGTTGISLRRDAGAIGAALHAVAPATPVVAAGVTIVLLVDLLLLWALVYAHRRVRPLLALHLERGRRP